MKEHLISASQLIVAIADPSNVGECRRVASRLAADWGFDEVKVGRVGIIATEIATNILRHAGSGTLLIQIWDSPGPPELEILGIDRGPGMNDIDHCMRDGFSTGGTAGNGLGAIARLSTVFDVFSTPGKGTVVMSRTVAGPDSSRAQPARRKFELGAICVAVAGEIECGDSWRVADDGTTVGMIVADGLGHGPLAAVASSSAVNAFAERPFDPPGSAMTSLHRAASGTRGTAAACALLHVEKSRVEYAGVGNISGFVVIEGRSRGMVSHNGTLGLQLLRSQQFEYDWPPGSHVVMHSDGLSARWSLSAYAGLAQHHPAIIAGVLFRDFARSRDDVTVLVARHPS